MSDLISRWDAIDALMNDPDWADAIPTIKSLPSADAVEVVRCKDCKHYQNEHICQYFSRFGTIETPSYGYCCFGERREP